MKRGSCTMIKPPLPYGGELTPAMNTYETNDKWTFRLSIPGATLETIDLKLYEDYFILHAPASIDAGFTKDAFRARERDEVYYIRQIQLPKHIDLANIACQFKNGILEVTLSKSPEHTKYNRAISIEH